MEATTCLEAEEMMRLFEQDIAEKMECLQMRLQHEFDHTLKTLDEGITHTIKREIVNTPNLKSIDKKALHIDKYDGTSPFNRFVERFCFVSKYNGWDPQTKSKEFINALIGKAALVLQKHHLDEDSSFESLESVLRNEFCDIDDCVSGTLIKHCVNTDNNVYAGRSKTIISAAIAELEFRNHTQYK